MAWPSGGKSRMKSLECASVLRYAFISYLVFIGKECAVTRFVFFMMADTQGADLNETVWITSHALAVGYEAQTFSHHSNTYRSLFCNIC